MSDQATIKQPAGQQAREQARPEGGPGETFTIRERWVCQETGRPMNSGPGLSVAPCAFDAARRRAMTTIRENPYRCERVVVDVEGHGGYTFIPAVFCTDFRADGAKVPS